MLVSKMCFERTLMGISSLTYLITQASFLLLSKRYDLENPSM